ncbi:MAG: hypothetical protein ABFD10_22530 [Prolixibacteraceae bacterium]
MNSSIKIVLFVLLLSSCLNNQKENSSTYYHEPLRSFNKLEACSSVSNDVFVRDGQKIIFCFNGNCAICFYKCKQFYSLFHQTLEQKRIPAFFVFISEFKDESLFNFEKMKMGQPVFHDINNEFTGSNNLDVSVEPQVLFIDKGKNVFLFKDLLNSSNEKKQFIKLIADDGNTIPDS